jgi:hypothetical protein
MCSRGYMHPLMRLHVLQRIHAPPHEASCTPGDTRIPVENCHPTWGSHSGGMKNSAFWDITQCSPLKVDRRFGGTYCLHFEVWINEARRQQAEPCRLIFNRLRDVISQKIELVLYLVLFVCLFIVCNLCFRRQAAVARSV